MNHIQEIDRLVGEIGKKQKTRDKLLHQLTNSLFIKSIWPNAFKDGSSCKVVAPLQTGHNWQQFERGKLEIDGAFIVRMDDNERFYLTPQQFRQTHERRKS